MKAYAKSHHFRHGRMSYDQYMRLDPRPACWHCGSLNLVATPTCPPPNIGGRVDCGSCGRWIRFFSLDHNLKKKKPFLPKRPELPVIRKDVWAFYDNRCVGCGISRPDFESVGLAAHVHHVEPYADVGHTTIYIPLCEQCHRKVTKVRRVTLQRLADLDN